MHDIPECSLSNSRCRAKTVTQKCRNARTPNMCASIALKLDLPIAM